MFSHDKPRFRPEQSLVDTIATRWLTLTNFAWFLAAVLTVVLVVLGVKSAEKLSAGSIPYRILAMDGVTLDMELRDMPTQNAVVVLFSAACGDACEKQVSTLLNLRGHQEKDGFSLYFIAMDDRPEDTLAYLKSIDFPESMTAYYAAPQAHASIRDTLMRIGSPNVNFTYPQSFLVTKPRKLVMEYQGYVRAQEILRTLRLHKLVRQ